MFCLPGVCVRVFCLVKIDCYYTNTPPMMVAMTIGISLSVIMRRKKYKKTEFAVKWSMQNRTICYSLTAYEVFSQCWMNIIDDSWEFIVIHYCAISFLQKINGDALVYVMKQATSKLTKVSSENSKFVHLVQVMFHKHQRKYCTFMPFIRI